MQEEVKASCEAIEKLKTKFEENIEQYHSLQYNEMNTRTDFIDELFKVLGWDINNSEGFAEQYREVVREDKVRVNGVQKAPDYSFRIGGTRKFFVEAKKPSVNIKNASEPAFQLRRYGYSAKLAISILTNFEEFAVYDTRIKPSKTDDAGVARIFYCECKDYLERFDFIYNTFSKTAILKGRLDRFVQENKHKKGTSEVDAELLKTLESWREELARNIALRNPEIKIYELNIAVQKIVDRIIFLRIAEDKGIEDYETLLNECKKTSSSLAKKTKLDSNRADLLSLENTTCFTQEGDNSATDKSPHIQKSSFICSVYSDLVRLFARANTKYNSGLFATIPYLDALNIDDAVLKKIIEGLYYPECPYEFSILPVEILGSIYEQFLGKTIKFRTVKGEKHTAIIEEKPEVKKAGGVYYTPEYIVGYIVEKTVGALIKERMSKPKATIDCLETLRIIDPSCGSGSFLVGAYSFLLKHALEYYSDEKHSKKALKDGRIYQAIGGAYRLTIEEKQRILLKHIFGVDIDEQAVEVAKLSLYLKLLEDEGAEASSRQELFRHTDFKILPSLMNNIQCGNALVDSEYYLKSKEELFEDDDARRAINVFDWDKRFAFVFAEGGFDCVIGNPPYVSAGNQVANENLNKQREYLKQCSSYKTLHKMWDLYIPFIEKSLNILKDAGLYGAIIPYPFTNQTYAESMRRLILQDYNLLEIADLKGTKVFSSATVTNCIPIIRKKTYNDNVEDSKAGILAISRIDAEQNIKIAFEKPVTELVIDERTGIWNLEKEVLNNSRHKDLHVLGDFCYISKGACVNSCDKLKRGTFKAKDLISNILDDTHTRRWIEPKDFSRYSINRIRYIEYGTKRSPEQWYRVRFLEWYDMPKLFINWLGNMYVTMDIENQFIHDGSTIGLALWKDLANVNNKSISSSIKKYSQHLRKEMEELSEQVNLYYLLAILNSTYASHLLNIQRGGDYHILPEHIRNLPIPIAPKAELEALTAYAKRQLELHAKLKEAKLASEKQSIQTVIASLDAKIDEIVYAIYGLTQEEIEQLQ